MHPDLDTLFMHRALVQSDMARIIAPPNPWVGCVIVKEGQVVGEGHTQAPGNDHAEISALKAAGERAKGATVYVTLEPCSHFGKTPPCANALIEAQVSRVVIALQDPDPNVNGKGIQLLRSARIKTDIGTCADLAFLSLEPYIHHRKTGRPFCIVKTATSIDGRIAAADGTSQWVTQEEARNDVQFLRVQSQAIVIGAGTAIADRPRLTVRDVYPFPLIQPLRVLLDTRGRVSAAMPLFEDKAGCTVVLTTSLCPPHRIKEWQKTGAIVNVIPQSASNEGVDLSFALDLLGKQGVIQALFEGGGTLIGSLWKQGFINQWTTYIGPCLLSETGIPVLKGVVIPTIKDAPRFQLVRSKQINDCVRLDYKPYPSNNDKNKPSCAATAHTR